MCARHDRDYPNASQRWTWRERWELLGRMERHEHWADIAQALGRSVHACRWQAYRLRSSLFDAEGMLLCRAARLLGVHRDCVRLWYRRGWLRGQLARWPTRRHLFFRYEDLADFVSDQRYVHLLDPQRIADDTLRELAREARASSPYLTVVEAAERLGVPPRLVGRYITARRIRAQRLGWRWLIHQDDCRLPDRPPRRETEPREVAYIRRNLGRLSLAEMARRLGRSMSWAERIASRVRAEAGQSKGGRTTVASSARRAGSAPAGTYQPHQGMRPPSSPAPGFDSPAARFPLGATGGAG